MKIIYNLAFLLLLQVPFASPITDGQQKLNKNKPGIANIVFKSNDGGQTWKDIWEGLSGKLEEGGFSLSRKIRICQVFYRQDPGQTQSIFVAPTLKGYEK
jgi:hypothetical protein